MTMFEISISSQRSQFYDLVSSCSCKM